MVTGAVPEVVPWLHRRTEVETSEPTAAIAVALTAVTVKSGLLSTTICLAAWALLVSPSPAASSAASAFSPRQYASAALAAVPSLHAALPMSGASDGGADRTPAWKSAVVMVASVDK